MKDLAINTLLRTVLVRHGPSLWSGTTLNSNIMDRKEKEQQEQQRQNETRNEKKQDQERNQNKEKNERREQK